MKTSPSASMRRGSPLDRRPVSTAAGRPIASPSAMEPAISIRVSVRTSPVPLPARPSISTSTSEKAISPQASSMATMPLSVRAKPVSLPASRITS